MRRLIGTILICGALLMLAAPCNAQDRREMGITAGFGLTNLSGEADGDRTKAALGLHGGAFVRFPLSARLVFQPEAQIVVKGFQRDDGVGDDKLSLTYLEFPVLMRYQPASTGTMKPSFFSGLSLGLLMSAKAGNADLKDDLAGTDIGFVLGAAIDFAAGVSGKISVEGRYTHGLKNINDLDSVEASVKNSVAFLGVSYLFPIGQ